MIFYVVVTLRLTQHCVNTELPHHQIDFMLFTEGIIPFARLDKGRFSAGILNDSFVTLSRLGLIVRKKKLRISCHNIIRLHYWSRYQRYLFKTGLERILLEGGAIFCIWRLHLIRTGYHPRNNWRGCLYSSWPERELPEWIFHCYWAIICGLSLIIFAIF